MSQLVELQKRAEDFRALDADVIVVYREEQSGVDGLKKIVQVSKTTFTLALDPDKNSSAAYSPEKKTFKNYVIDRTGQVRKILPGTKTRRATADQLLEALREIREADDGS